MGTNRNLLKLRTYNYAQKNHWQFMCDISDNDYDINYFSGRGVFNDNLEYFFQCIEDKKFNINKILKYIKKEYEDECAAKLKFYNENNFYSEHIQGYLDELELTKRIIEQKYC